MGRTFYYYYYLLYKKSSLDGEPQLTARLTLSASEIFLLISLVRISSAFFFCYDVSKYYMFAIALIVLLLNTFVFLPPKKVEWIIQSKPKFFNSHILSIILTWLFFLITTSSLFWLENVVEVILGNCGN